MWTTLLVGWAVHTQASTAWVSVDLPSFKPDAAPGNPMKGFMPNTDWTGTDILQEIPSSLEFHYMPVNAIMNTGPDDLSGFDSYLEPRLAGSASRSSHAVLRFWLDSPGSSTGVPQFLLDGGLERTTYTEYGGGESPDYDSEALLTAIEGFVAGFGDRYDGDPRIYVIQIGILGFWGEWHTYPHNYLTESARDRVVTAFAEAFTQTKLQLRVPWPLSMDADNIGYHDDSFTYSTLDGDDANGVSVGWYFWPSMIAAGTEFKWELAPMGGELRPENQATVFSDSFPAPSATAQEFLTCVEKTHTSFMLNSFAYDQDGYREGPELDRARNGAMAMGYSFFVSDVRLSRAGTSLRVTVTNAGVAPFYYPLNLTVSCGEEGGVVSQPGVDTVLGNYDTRTFDFRVSDVLGAGCLDRIDLSLTSAWLYRNRPVKWSQGDGPEFLGVNTPPLVSPCGPEPCRRGARPKKGPPEH